MQFNISTIAPFRSSAKRLLKKYPSLKMELLALQQELLDSPRLGTSLGNNCYKIRLAIASKGKGKSGGARIITHFYVDEDTVYLLYMYDKSSQANISDKELKELLKYIE